MTVKRLELSARARADLLSIWRYTEHQWDEAQAERYSDIITAAMSALTAGTHSHRTKISGYFGIRVESHVIFYRELRSSIRVLRILHVRMDAARHLR